ncbi:hypothetical protein ACFXP3_25545 [Streptomyces sp. NPDC059096]|uniref:hypothetical protein n=1 Tax=Streptomyces sp. NPDC059096 TaxID=3346727 RepID=UPI00367D1241
MGKPYPPEAGADAGSKVSVRYDPAKPKRIELPGYKGSGVLTNLMWFRSLLATVFVDESGQQRPVDGFADRHEF